MSPAELLDNPVWHALAGPQATLAEGTTHARRYDPALAPFAALPDDVTPEAWDALRALIGPGHVAILVRHAIPLPSGWEPAFAGSAYQMIGSPDVEAAAAPTFEVSRLSAADVPEMLALIEQTRPGPFLERTIELGRYVGVHRDGVLAAMAGERMRPPGYTEISAVCTAPAYQAQGLGAGLVRLLARSIHTSGDVPILHVAHDNAGAIRVYERVGFTTRTALDIIGVRAPR